MKNRQTVKLKLSLNKLQYVHVNGIHTHMDIYVQGYAYTHMHTNV